MPTFSLVATPIQLIRQFAEAPYLDMKFNTTAEREAYLTSPRAYPGLYASDLEQDSAMWVINAAGDAWNPVGANNLVIGLGSKTFTVLLDGTTGKGEVGNLEIPITDVPADAFITFAFIDVYDGLIADDETAYVTLGIEVDKEDAALDEVSGLVTELNSGLPNRSITPILNPDYTKATSPRKLVMAVGGSNITAGKIRVIIVLTDKIVQNGEGGGTGSVESVTGLDTDNTDPINPIVRISVDGTSITGQGTPGDPLVSVGGSGSPLHFGIEDNLGIQDRSVNMQTHSLTIFNGSDLYLESGDSSNNEEVITGLRLLDSNNGGNAHIYASLASTAEYSQVSLHAGNVIIDTQINGDYRSIELDITSVRLSKSISSVLSTQTFPDVDGNFFIPLSVSINGDTPIVADAAGNIDLSITGGGATPTLQQAFDASVTAGDDPKINIGSTTGGLLILDSTENLFLSLNPSNGRLDMGSIFDLNISSNNDLNLNAVHKIVVGSSDNNFIIQGIKYGFPTAQGTNEQVLGIDSIDGDGKAILYWKDVTGSGATPTLQQVLTQSNITGGIGIQLDDNNEPYLINALGNFQIESDVNNGLRINQASGAISANFNDRQLFDNDPTISIDWQARTLYNAGGGPVFNYGAQEFVQDIAFTNANLNINGGDFNILNGGATITDGTTGAYSALLANEGLYISNSDGSARNSIVSGNPTTNRIAQLQDKDGIIAYLDDITGGGSTPNLQAVTDVDFQTTNPIVSSAGLLVFGDGSNDLSAGVRQTTTNDTLIITVKSGETTPYLEYSLSSAGTSTLRADNFTAPRNWQLPDNSGTIALLSDITGGGSTPNLQTVTDVAPTTAITNPIISTIGFAALKAGGNTSVLVGDLTTNNGIALSYSSGIGKLSFNYGGISKQQLTSTLSGTNSRSWELPDADGTIPVSVQINGTPYTANNQGLIDLGTISGGGSGATASNGLSIDGGTGDVILGGTLANDTTITQGSSRLIFTANTQSFFGLGVIDLTTTGTGSGVGINVTSGGNFGILSSTPAGTAITGIGLTGINGYSTSGTGVNGSSGEGSGIYGASQTGVAGEFVIQHATPNNTVDTIVKLTKNTLSGAADGIGGSLDFYITDNLTVPHLSNQIISKWTTAAVSTRTSELSITGVNSATTNTLLRISGAGIFTLVQGLTNYANDAAAATGGIPVNGLYRNGSVVQIRVS